MRELGMEEEKIQKLRQMDREDFLEERRYREHLDETMQDMDSIKEKDSELFARDVKELLDAQIRSNMAIAHEGMTGKYGLGIGRVIRENYSHDMLTRMRSLTAAASEARMGGCDMPVVINSGSGNQGITVTLPVVEYAKELGVSREKLYRALLISNLIAIHEKSGIGRLSAYCGAVSAGAGAGAAVTYLMGGDENCIGETVINALAVTSGIVCDGAKSSCAAKIATAVEAGLLGGDMARTGRRFLDNEGLVKESAEDSIRNFARLGRDGMRETDKEIIRMMIE